ncbi:hypothetical protein B0H10DRAFT_2304138 [Mycena sp. CBHHK59/15]|nr:hypothetical protein B0H10DRAFT_2304138 [Mycena sp. CBHHK59/15]
MPPPSLKVSIFSKINEQQKELLLVHLTEGSPHISWWGMHHILSPQTRATSLSCPQLTPKKIMVQRDMRYGPDDPVLWPQLYTNTFCHLAAIPKDPTSAQGQQKFGVMWWNPAHDDFVCPKSGLTLTRGLGRLCLKRFTKLSDLVHALIDEYEQYLKSLPAGTTLSPLFPRLVQNLCLSLEHLRILTTYTRMRLGVVSVQREYLELTGLLQYMTKCKPRMEGIKDLNAHTAYPNDCIGCFTQDPRIAQCMPPVLVPPASPSINTLWYPFAAASPNIASTSLTGSPDVASTSGAGTSASGTFRGGRQRFLVGKYAAARAQAKVKKEAQGPNPNAKVAHDKFLPFQHPEMPTPITPWADALKAIDRGRPPSCGIDLPQHCVLPEPALVVSPDEEPHCRMFYHHYRLLRDALMFRLADPNVPPALLSTQQWRDVLQGKVVKQGKTGTRAQAPLRCCPPSSGEMCCRAKLSNRARRVLARKHAAWAVVACLPSVRYRCFDGISSTARSSPKNVYAHCKGTLVGAGGNQFPLQVPRSGCVRFWAGSTRRVLQVFCGRGTDWAGFPRSQRGLAALGAMDRLPYLLCAAGLMCDWSVPCTRPKEIDTAEERTESEWDGSTVCQLERKVAQYYTQRFYELFRRAAVSACAWSTR